MPTSQTAPTMFCFVPLAPASFHRAAVNANTGCAAMMTPMPRYVGIEHASMLVADTARAKKFYMDVLGMADDNASRSPQLTFKGAFLRAGVSQIHLMELPSPAAADGRPAHRDKHVAITLRDLDPLIASLDAHGRRYTFNNIGRRALFTRDLDANALEFVEEKTPE